MSFLNRQRRSQIVTTSINRFTPRGRILYNT